MIGMFMERWKNTGSLLSGSMFDCLKATSGSSSSSLRIFDSCSYLSVWRFCSSIAAVEIWICKIIGRDGCEYKEGYARSLGGLSVSTRRDMQDHWKGWM